MAISTVVAVICPEIRVTVVLPNAEQVLQCNANQFSPFLYGANFIDYMRKCHNRNLFFTTNINASIIEADLIILVSDSEMKTYGDGKEQMVDLTQIQEMANLIAAHSESNKIIVESSNIPYRSAECIREILNSNKLPEVEFQVLSIPSFYDEGCSFGSLLEPELVLIGVEDTPETAIAVKELTIIFERWIDPERVYIGNERLVELGKLFIRAVIAQRLTNVFALAAVCEKVGANFLHVMKVISNDPRIGFHPKNVPFNLEDFSRVVSTLTHVADSVQLSRLSEYWREVYEMFKYHHSQFTTKLTYPPNGNLRNRRLALFGFACYTQTKESRGSVAIDIAKYILEAGGQVNIYDPNVNDVEVVHALLEAGCQIPKENLKKVLNVHHSPKEALLDCETLIVCIGRPEIVNVKFGNLFNLMCKPAYLFDYGNILDHNNLLKIGFNVRTIGKSAEKTSFR
ncbi:hypothetical protein RUM44_006351 [Polyplax serrata]|uniref:UDP-glucose 6-dehydrogenase n=1 Tax=Polyplax serrata TaxID=468196 RepID=A0ABR1AHV4_POLSC